MTQSDLVVLPYSALGNIVPERNRVGYDILLAPQELQENMTVKLRKLNRKRIRSVAMVMLVATLFFRFYAAFGGSVVLNEIGTAVAHFEPAPVQHSSSQYMYYLVAWWSPSHGDKLQSMINAIYAVGLGWIITYVADLVNAAVGHQALVGAQAVSFVAGLLVGVFYGASVGVAASEGAAESGVAITFSAAVLSALGIVAVGWIAALSAA